jgi:hypothetical protein
LFVFDRRHHGGKIVFAARRPCGQSTTSLTVVSPRRALE